MEEVRVARGDALPENGRGDPGRPDGGGRLDGIAGLGREGERHRAHVGGRVEEARRPGPGSDARPEGLGRVGVDGSGVADEPPAKDFEGMPKLTTRMAARLQGFPDEWSFWGRKTTTYRQIGNAFPPPVARAVGLAIAKALKE